MKNLYQKTKLLAAGAIFMAYSAAGQVASIYTFSQFSGVYNPIPYAAPGATMIAQANEDDNTYGNIPLGFSFNFNNTAYSTINLNINGWIAMGPNSQGSSYTPISTGRANSIAFWAADLRMGPSQSASTTNGSNVVVFTFTSGAEYFEPGDVVTGGNIPAGTTVLAVAAGQMTISANATGTGAVTLGSTGQISYLTTGTAPTRTFTIQWRKAGRYNITSTGLNDYFNAQIKLYETTNVIDIIYGKCGTGNGNTTTHQVGLCGATSADYNNRAVAAGAPWSASTAGANNGATCTFNSSTAPALGQVYRWAPPQCAGITSQGTATANILNVCPGGNSNLTLANSYTAAGYTYTWMASNQSVVGIYTVIPNANGSAYTATNITAPAWYQLVATCLNSNSTASSVPVYITVAGTTTNSVPYKEDFEGVAVDNMLPNCSWSAVNLGSTSMTYTNSNTSNRIPYSGTKFASFYYSPAASNHFYTNGIQLYAGVTYTASMWFTTEYFGYNTWNLTMRVGPNQSAVGTATILNIPIATSPNYKQVGNTFTVPTSGLYYININAVSNGVCCGNYLSWDDLEVRVPCELNTPTLSLGGTTVTSVCAGDLVTLNVSGASTYTWNTGSNAITITDNPLVTTNYVVVGTNTASGCPATISKNVVVHDRPQVSVFSFAPAICEGKTATVSAVGANSYTWNTGDNTPVLTVIPASSGTVAYMVTGANQYGCTSTATQVITVNPLPAVTAVNSPTVSCAGDNITLSGFGATTYQWMTNNTFVQGAVINANPLGSTVYSVTGTDANGCSKMAIINHAVETCVGIREVSKSLQGLILAPNPNNGNFTVELANTSGKTIEVMDVTGRLILSQTSSSEVIPVNISNLANGVYYVKVKCNDAADILKVVKQ